MRTLAFTLALSLLAATPSRADEPNKTYRLEIPREVRTEFYLERSKARAAARADRLTGSNTFAKARERRLLAKPRRYVPRYVKVKAMPDRDVGKERR